MTCDMKKSQYTKYKQYLTSLKVTKCSLKSILKYDHIFEKINDAVYRTNKIVTYTLQFLKLYYLHNLDNGIHIDIDGKLVNTIMKIICVRDKRGRKSTDETNILKVQLTEFYDNHFKKLITDHNLTYTNLNTVLDYETISILTMYNNHIINNFYAFINRYINCMLNKKTFETTIKDHSRSNNETRELITSYRKILRKFKMDIFKQTNKYKIFEKLKKEIRKLLPKIPSDKPLMYYVKMEPFMFLPMLVKMSIQLENNGYKPINCFPLRKSLIPSYIKLDTTTIIHLLFTKKIKRLNNKYKYLRNRNTIKYRDKIWKFLFKTEKKIFNKKGYKFNHMITTDGIGCSVLLIRKDIYKPSKRNKIRPMKVPNNYKETKYIQEENKNILKKLRKYNVVGIDPGKEDLLYCTDGRTNKKGKYNTFRYSKNQYKKETNTRIFKKLQEKELSKKNNGLSIYDMEEPLIKTSSKSNTYKIAKRYIKVKNKISDQTREFYKKYRYRMRKWVTYKLKQKSLSKMINRFKNIFGDPSKTIVCIGDWSPNKQMKYNEPSKGKSFRKVFKNHRYKIYLVDEYNTSKKLYKNGGELEKFKIRRNPRPYKNNLRKVHGLLRLKSVHNSKMPKKTIIVNRDKNGSLNILQKAKCIIRNKQIPKYLHRINRATSASFKK